MQAADFIARLQQLKLRRGWNWEEIGKAVDLSRSMIHFIKVGKYSVSDKAAKRLRQLEAEAGISPRAQSVIDGISRQTEKAKPKVSKSDIKAGCTEIEVEFLTGQVPSDTGNRIRLSRPDIRTRSKLVGKLKEEGSYHPVLLSCLPTELATESFLNQLTIQSYNALAEASMALTFGVDWEKGASNSSD